MRRLIILQLTLFAALLLFAGCGHLAGNDPEGVTGGHEGGYGALGSDLGTGGYFVNVLGRWRHTDPQGNYDVITFNSDGSLLVEFFSASSSLQLSQTGTYYISGNRISFSVPGWETGSGTLALQGDVMALISAGNTVIYNRIR